MLVPDTRVLAIASHVRVTSRATVEPLLTIPTGSPRVSLAWSASIRNGLCDWSYVGNKMATFVMQSMGCDVSAINTVNYSKPPVAEESQRGY
jgi:hypothetical protein